MTKPPNTNEIECILNEEELQDLLLYYQKLLRLQDWNIKVCIVRQRDMEQEGKAGGNHFILPTKTSWIELRDPLDYPSDCFWPQDMETTLVHELLHLHIAAVTVETREHNLPAMLDDSIEQAIEAISQAIVALKRSAKT